MTAIATHDLRFTYPARRRQPAREALRGVSLDVPEGQSVAVLGPNGSGKSTLIRVLTGMLDPSSGTALVCDQPPEQARGMLGVVFQNPGLDRHMTVWENLRDSAVLYGMSGEPARTMIDALLRDLRLDDRRHALVKTLSGGLARRVDLCRALLSDPKVLVLDEPTTGLDPIARTEFLEQVEARRRASGATLLMSTHLIDEAERADRVIMMYDGVVAADDAPASLRSKLGAQRATVLDARWSPDAADGSAWTRVAGGWVRPLASAAEAQTIANRLAAANLPFMIAPPTLGDVFAHLTGSALTEGDGANAASQEAA